MSDFLVVGAGVAGCVVARSLADIGAEVTLVEAGPSELPTELRRSNLMASQAPEWHWPGSYPRGKGLGGGSAINAMVAAVAQPVEYEQWPGGYEKLQPFIEEITHRVQTHAPAMGSFTTALREIGKDVSPVSLFADANGQRRTFADAFLTNAPANLKVLTDTQVDGLVADGDEVRGVKTGNEDLRADLTILSAGVLGTSSLLGLIGVECLEGKDRTSYALELELVDEFRATNLNAAAITGTVGSGLNQIVALDHGGQPDSCAALLADVSARSLVDELAEELLEAGVATKASPGEARHYHLCSTLPLGSPNGVDHGGRISGLDGLAVIDASVLPTLLSCSPSLSLAALSLLMTGSLL